jgi:hypothetical protein
MYYSSSVDHYFVKLGPGNALAGPLLSDQRLNQPAVAGFFRDVRLTAIQDADSQKRPRFSRQALDLYRWAEGDLPGYAITVALGAVWVLEPTGPMYEMERETFERTVGHTPHDDDVPKIVPVHIAYTDDVGHIPTLLAQIMSNRRLSSSTFKQITDDFGTQLAVDHLLFKAGLQDTYPHIAPDHRSLYDLLRCLSASELIALVGRLLEEQGLHVPAPTGGFVKNVDLFAYNDHALDRNIGGVRVAARERFRSGVVALQVRRETSSAAGELSPEVDYLLQLNGEEGDGKLGCEWIAALLRRSPHTRAWLARLLRWVPFSGCVLGEMQGEHALEFRP